MAKKKRSTKKVKEIQQEQGEKKNQTSSPQTSSSPPPEEEEEEEVVGPASTEQILGLADSSTQSRSKRKKKVIKEEDIEVPSYVKPEWAKFYRKLMAMKMRILEQMEALAEESTSQLEAHSIHEADIGTDHYDRDFALSLLSSDQELLYEIEEALRRIERGTYGICEITGKPIPKARLEAIPWTRFTVEAQEQLEREGVIQPRRFANLGHIPISSNRATEEESIEGEPEVDISDREE